MSFGRTVIVINAIAFGGFGLLFLFAADRFLPFADIPINSGTARADLLAIYAGCELGIAAFLGWTVACKRRTRAGLMASIFIMSGFALARIVGIATGGEVKPLIWWLLASEVGGVAVSLLALFRDPNAAPE
jgi:hypothetical protein